jgi:hypothetical protein
MLLPPGTIAALKGHPNGVVTVALYATAVGAMAVGAPSWGVVAAMAIAFWMFHNRCCSAERHAKEMAQNKVDEAAVNVEAIKARHRDLLLSGQPGLPLEIRRRRQTSGQGKEEPQ